MRAIVVTEFGGPEVLELQDVPAPEGEVVVDVSVAGVNFRDIYERKGSYGGTYPLEDARRAQEDLESRSTTGKLLLTVA